MIDPDYGRVERARLVAENNARGVTGSAAQAATKINQFYKELELTPNDLNNAVASYYSQPKQERHRIPVEVYAIREIADMIYQGSYTDYASLSGVAQVNFQSDVPSALKMRLAPFARTERVRTLVNDLAHSTYIGQYEKCEMQLADDEGSITGQAAAAQLRTMDGHRKEYSKEGFDAIFSVLGGAGDKTEAALVDHYTHDQDGYIASFAKTADPDVAVGHHGLFVADY